MKFIVRSTNSIALNARIGNTKRVRPQGAKLGFTKTLCSVNHTLVLFNRSAKVTQ